jgi:hypothetical protein
VVDEDELRRARRDVERYRQAAEGALEQLDWCIGYLHGADKRRLAAVLARNRTYIREHLLQRSPQPTPSHPSQPTADE